MPRHLHHTERREPTPFLIDGQEVEAILGQCYYFMGLDLVATVVAVDVPALTITVEAPELRTPRVLPIRDFEHAIDAGLAARR